MHVQIEDLSPVEKKLAVEIPWDQVKQKLDAAYRMLGTQVQLNGFRKGKIPRSVLEARFGKHVQKEVAKELVQESFLRAAEEHKIEPVAEPVVEEAVLKPGENFRYSARIEIRAPVELQAYDGLEAKRVKLTVAQDEVDRALEQKRMAHTEFRPITGREVSQPTDVLVIAVKGKVGDVPVERPEISVDLGTPEHDPLPGLVAALTGIPLAASDHEVVLQMPPDAEHKEIAGQTATLSITVKDAREKVVPPLDDDFAKDTGEADTLDELRAKTREALERQARERADRDMREEVIKELVNKNPLPVAPALIDRGIESQLQRARMSLAMQGIDLDRAGVDLSGMRERLRDGAANEIRGQLLLEAIADKEGIEISDADIDAKIAELARAQQKPAHKVKAEMAREGTVDTLRWRLRQEKALDLVVSRATISEVEPAPEPEPTTEPAAVAPEGAPAEER